MISADLGNRLETFVTSLVESGRYNSKSEVLREGVRLIQDRETQLAALDLAIAQGLAQADAGQCVDAKEMFDGLESTISLRLIRRDEAYIHVKSKE